MYAITFDLDADTLRNIYHLDAFCDAYMEIEKVLVGEYEFTKHHQSSVYFGGTSVNAVTCVLAVQDLTNRFAWFGASAKKISMLRVEDCNDLMPVVQQSRRVKLA